MPVGEIHQDDVGTVLLVTIKDENDVVVDVSTAVTKNIILKKPDGTIETHAASFVTDGTDGQIQYVTVAGDIDAYGAWSLQAFIDFGAVEWYSDIVKFKVYPNLGC